MIATRNKIQKAAAVLAGVVGHSNTVRIGAGRIYNDLLIKNSPIRSISQLDYLGQNISVSFENFFSVDGNVTLPELVFIATLARIKAPKRVVEIGTFDGNTTLQLAVNTPDDTEIYTLDLPIGLDTSPGVDGQDARYIVSDLRVQRRFLNTRFHNRIRQCYGDSLLYDFAQFAEGGKPDFIFIDAGHSYECVRNDTEKSLEILAPGGTIVWQDFGSSWPGVYQYLAELSGRLNLLHIEETSLVVYQS